MDYSPLVDSSITANTAACAVFILAKSLKRQGLLDDEAVNHLRHLLDGQIELFQAETDSKRMHQRWRRQIDE